jgi:hypothetical protein
MKQIPEIGKTYNCFDDGKISHSRLYTVDVVDVIPFENIDEDTLNEWKEKVEECDWLFAKETDYFIKTANGEDGWDSPSRRKSACRNGGKAKGRG